MNNTNKKPGCPKNSNNTPKVVSVPVKEIHGITYFKLQSDYPGDYRKGCGLLGNEIDENFYFLRSNDIKTAYTETVEDRKILVLVKVDDEEIRVDITEEEGEYRFREEDGFIYIKFLDGHEEPIKDENDNPVRFLIEGSNVRIVTDASIDGDGTYGNPIALDPAYQTGTYEPADFFVDLTCPDASIKDYENIGRGHNIVTKENVSRFGALYTFGQAKAINEALKGSGWRVPSKEDWAKLLNWAEIDDTKRNHDTDKSGNFGCVAGARLKSILLWEKGKENTDNFGFTIYPVGFCPENFNAAEPSQYGFDGLYKVSQFWSTSENDGEAYTRKFSYVHDDVAQYTEPPMKRLSIRLVRDTMGDFDAVEYANILGYYVPVVLTTDGKQQWTALNINFTNYDGYDPNQVTVPEEWQDVNTDIEAITFYQLIDNGDGTYSYSGSCDGNGLSKYDIPSYVDENMPPITEDEIPENPVSGVDEEYIAVKYIIHLDMVTEAKFYFNAWDGRRWHKKLMKEGESVVLLYDDAENVCDTAATPYVTSANTNHEWRVFVNELTGLDELVDTVEALKRELYEELKRIEEEISEVAEDVTNLSGVVETMYDEMVSGFSSAFTEISNAQTEIDKIEEGVGLDENGEFIPNQGNFTSAATNVEEEIAAIDEVLKETVDNVAELMEKKLEPGDNSIELTPDPQFPQDSDTTYIRVKIDAEDTHIKVDENGVWFDGDFGEID